MLLHLSSCFTLTLYSFSEPASLAFHIHSILLSYKIYYISNLTPYIVMALSWRQASVTHPKARDDYEWSAGDIAFLRSHREFNRHDFTTFIRSKQLERGATSHPVIILTRRSTTATHVLVTPVSAYSSGPDNGYRPPWTQRRHRSKARHDFRAFCGSVRPQNERAHLFLEAGSMPKPETSVCRIIPVSFPLKSLEACLISQGDCPAQEPIRLTIAIVGLYLECLPRSR